MGSKPFTASERRGIIAIAFIAFAVRASGFLFTLCDRISDNDIIPEVIELEEMIDSTSIREKQERTGGKSKKKSKKTGKGKRPKTLKEKKIYRKRNPLDEPV